MGNIKTYDWTSDEGLLQKRSVIYEEFYKDGKKHYKLVDDLKPEEHRAPIIEAEGYDDILKIIEVEPDKEKMDDWEYELVPVPEEISERIKNEQKENFRLINEILKVRLDLEKVYGLIDGVEITEKIDKNEETSLGVYREGTNQVGLVQRILYGNTEKAKRVRLHEFIHLIQTLDRHLNIIVLDESQVENLATIGVLLREKNNNNNQIVYFNNLNGKTIYIHYDYNVAKGYTQSASILKQMEVAMGKKFYEENLLDRIGFYRDFAYKYGKDLLKYLTARMDTIDKDKIDDYDEKAKYIQETQDVLFKEVFNKDIEAIGSTEGSIRVLQKILRMKKYKPCIQVVSEEEFNTYNSFPELYDQYYRKIGRKLSYIGCDKTEIVEALEPYRYDYLEKQSKVVRNKRGERVEVEDVDADKSLEKIRQEAEARKLFQPNRRAQSEEFITI